MPLKELGFFNFILIYTAFCAPLAALAAPSEADAFREAYQKMKEAHGGKIDSKAIHAIVEPAIQKGKPQAKAKNSRDSKPQKHEPATPQNTDADAEPIVDPASVPKYIEFEKSK
jgi:hypothetical protein